MDRTAQTTTPQTSPLSSATVADLRLDGNAAKTTPPKADVPRWVAKPAINTPAPPKSAFAPYQWQQCSAPEGRIRSHLRRRKTLRPLPLQSREDSSNATADDHATHSNLALSIPFATVSPNRPICLEVLIISFGTAISPFRTFSKLVLVSVVFCHLSRGIYRGPSASPVIPLFPVDIARLLLNLHQVVKRKWPGSAKNQSR